MKTKLLIQFNLIVFQLLLERVLEYITYNIVLTINYGKHYKKENNFQKYFHLVTSLMGLKSLYKYQLLNKIIMNLKQIQTQQTQQYCCNPFTKFIITYKQPNILPLSVQQIVQNMRSLLKRILGYLHHIDNKFSGRVHQIDNIIISCILYPFAAFFHPGLIWIAFSSMYFFSNYNLNFLIVYVVGVLLCLLTIYLLKKALKRDRPVLVLTSKKPHHFRKKQKNHAMPSGDAIQSALFVTFLNYLSVPIPYLIIFHVGVCLGRVYYMCHWIADTVVASFLGVGIAWYFLGAYEELNLSQITAFQL